MFRPNMFCYLLKKLPTRTIMGKEMFAEQVRIPCAIVHLKQGSAASSVRADSSATRGAAEDMLSDAKILVPAATQIGVGDVLRIEGMAIEVTGREIRKNVAGNIDHYELVGDIRAEL